MSPRTFGACVLLNLLLIGLYVWSATETTTIAISARGSHLVAAVNGYELAVDYPAQGAHIGLYRAGPELERTHVPSAAQSPVGWTADLIDLLRADILGSAWRRVTLSDGNGTITRDEIFGQSRAAEWDGRDGDWSVNVLGEFLPAREGNALLSIDAGSDFNLKAELRRGAAPAGVMVRAADARNGLLLFARPEHRDLQWFVVRDGQLGAPLAGGFFSKNGVDILQDDLRLLSNAYLVSLALVLLALLFRSGYLILSVHRTRAPRLPDPRPVGSYHSELPALCHSEYPRVPGTLCKVENILCCEQRSEESIPLPRSDVEKPSDHQEILRFAQDDNEPARADNLEHSRHRHPVHPVPFLPYSLPLAVAIAAAVFAATAYIAYYVLEAMPHVQDDLTYLFQARVIALGRLSVPSSPEAEAFTQEFIVNHAGQAFGKYPPGHPLALLPGVVAGVPWLINPLQAGLTVLVLFFLARKVYGRRVAILASLLAATSPFLLFMSGSMMAHPTELLFISLFALLYVRTHEPSASPISALLAGLALGFALVTRPWTAIGVAAPFGIHAAYRLASGRGRDLSRYLPLVAGAVPLLIGLLAYNWLLTGSPLTNPMELWWPFDKIGFGKGIGISGEHNLAAGLWNTYRNLGELNKELFGWPANLTLALASVPFVTLRARKWDYLFLFGWLGVVLAQIAWWADGIMYGPRYYYETLGFLVLLTARGFFTLAEIAVPFSLRLATRPALPVAQAARHLAAPAFFVLFALALIAYNVVYYLPEQLTLHRGYNYINGDSLRAVAAQQIHHAVVFVDTGEWFEWWNYGSVFSANTPTLDGDVVYARDRGATLNERVVALYPGREYFKMRGTVIEELRQ